VEIPVRVNFYATLRPLVGRKTVEIPLPGGATVRELLDAVVQKFPALAPRLLDEAGALRSHVHLFINGRDAPYLSDRLDTRLAATDSIDVFPAVGGGAI
jgi:molybdopterin synthase sulfur carrier subunit